MRTPEAKIIRLRPARLTISSSSQIAAEPIGQPQLTCKSIFALAFKFKAVAAGADRGRSRHGRRAVEVNVLGYNYRKSADSFRFRNNFLSCDVAGMTRSFPA